MKIINFTFRHKFYQFLSVQQNIKCSRTICMGKYHNNVDRFSDLSFSKYRSQRILCNVSLLISQRRNILSGKSDIEDSDKLTPDLSPVDEASNLIFSATPQIIKNISELKIIQVVQEIFLNVHEITGLPWWATISLTSFITKILITLPLTLSQVRTQAKLELIRLEMNDIAKRLNIEGSYLKTYHQWPDEIVRYNFKKKIKQEWTNLIIRDNCHPAKCYILALVQIPLWIAFSFAIRNLCLMLPKQDFHARLTYLELTVGGFGWIKNLTDIDHFMILPITLALLNLIICEIHRLFKIGPKTKFEKRIQIFLRILIIGTIPITVFIPSALQIYWISSSSYGLIQAFLINSIRIRRLFRIPVTESELKHPYQHFYNNLKTK